MEATLNASRFVDEPDARGFLPEPERRRLEEQDRRIEGAVERERPRLRRFIRRRVDNEGDADDLLQEVFYELVEAYRLMKPIEEVTAWLFQVARNRIRDFGRKKKAVAFADVGPEAEYARGVLLEELEDVIDELPEAQREAFVGHEMEGRSFQELAAESGASVNAVILRKHYAVQHLRKRLAAIREEFAARR